jgi:hypothetical protein
LQDTSRIYLYIHHAASHQDVVSMPVNFQLEEPRRLRWIRPSTNETIRTDLLPAGRNMTMTPPFQIDMVAVLESVSLGNPGTIVTNVAIGIKQPVPTWR